MRIEPRTTQPVSDTTQRPSTAAAPQASPAKGDASSVVTIGAQVADDAQIDPAVAQRIQTIKAQLASGSYPIDLGRLAGKLVDDAHARVGGKQK